MNIQMKISKQEVCNMNINMIIPQVKIYKNEAITLTTARDLNVYTLGQ